MGNPEKIDDNKNPYQAKRDGRVLITDLFFLIDQICSNIKEKKEKMREVCDWLLSYVEVEKKRQLREEMAEKGLDEDGEDGEKGNNDGDDNILKALLTFMEDEICLNYMGFYSTFLDEELLLYALGHNNSDFVRKSLLLGAFDKQYFKKDSVVDRIIMGID